MLIIIHHKYQGMLILMLVFSTIQVLYPFAILNTLIPNASYGTRITFFNGTHNDIGHIN